MSSMSASAVANPFEVAGRLTKAFAIARMLHRFNITSQETRLATAEEWATAAKAAGYSHASEETRRLTIEKLEGIEEFEP